MEETFNINNLNINNRLKKLNSLRNFNKGDYIIHLQYGIALYNGLKIVDIYGHQKKEFISLIFHNNETLYVPIYALNMINKYSNNNLHEIKLSKLGTSKWKIEKEKIAKKITDIAADLLSIYAQRSIKKGYANILNKIKYKKFCNGFNFKETVDQNISMNDVIKDLINEKPMDRLICGDVGFGKTEIALRASFIVTNNKKKVVFLVPTTLLAEQHFETFKNRFSTIGINVLVLSRLKKNKQVLESINNKSNDIIIGTHKLLSYKRQFNNLGLLIIDEEHRFGVQQKEQIKQFRSNIDILTMTATPIPRTLDMVFSKIRDVSIISTAPNDRRSVKTFIKTFNIDIIKEAVNSEILRNGQVFYLYNSVETINKKFEQLRKIFPNINIAIIHGQMPEIELKEVMYNFKNNNYKILICTTIIENGIDIPNVNTIIIERADRFGLAQLHQLRGRVGRSSKQAYAYLLIPNNISLNKDAIKRLNAIADIDSLGGGYKIANYDLEIRGSGEILGKEQSGNIKVIGLNLYIEFLDKAIHSLKTWGKIDIQDLLENTIIELNIPTFFPIEYIYQVDIRLYLYQCISKVSTVEDLNKIKQEIINQFGPLPEYALYLFDITYIRIKSYLNGIKKININDNGGKIIFMKPLKMDPIKLIKIINQHQYLELNKNKEIIIIKKIIHAKDRILFIKNFIDKINFFSKHKHK